MAYIVPFVNPSLHFKNLCGPIMEIIEKVLASGNLILRDELREFEKNFANFIGTKYAIGVNSGTDALFLALKSLEFKPSDEIITVSHTCIATVSAIVNAGASPVLVDIGEDFNMDMDLVEKAITSHTRAIVPVHLNGRACDMDRLMDIAQRHSLLVIEDGAQAVGAEYGGQKVGTFGVVGCFSLYPFKMLGAFGDGGIVVTNSSKLAPKVRVLRDYGEDRETGEILYFGYNSRLDNLQAAIVNLKLKYLPDWIRRRREIAQTYMKGLADIPEVKLPPFSSEKFYDVYMNYCILTKVRDKLVPFLKEQGVEPLTPISLIIPVHLHKALGFNNLKLPQTERIAREFIYLPIHPEMTDKQVDYVVHCIRKFFDRN